MTTARRAGAPGGRGLLDHHPHNPLRRPGWRWGRARALAEAGARPGRLDDDWGRRAFRVAVALGRHGDPGHPRVAAADPALVAALSLHASPDPRLRFELEARLLAGQSDPELAGKVGVPEAVVAAFASVLFDVRSSLDKIDWIAAVVLGGRAFDGTGAGDPELEARLVGLALGPVVVDALFGRLADRGGRLADGIRRCIALATAPVTPATAPRWLALAARQAEVDRHRDESSASAVSGPLADGADLEALLPTTGATVPSGAEPGEPPVGAAAVPGCGVEDRVAPMRLTA
jgi:hypothetical protein